VKPALVSYDHYQFKIKGDGDQYFLNLAMIRRPAERLFAFLDPLFGGPALVVEVHD
jgi:hypothetical protein